MDKGLEQCRLCTHEFSTEMFRGGGGMIMLFSVLISILTGGGREVSSLSEPEMRAATAVGNLERL